MHWFRFYDGVVDDPKVQRLPPAYFRFWVNLLCLASANKGVLPSLPDLSFSLRIAEKQISEMVGKLKSMGLVDATDAGLEPHNWNGRQFKTDVSTERVREFRKRHKKPNETVSRNAPDTEQIQSRTEQKGRASRFDDFWKVCPRKVGKGAAKIAFVKAIKTTTAETLIQAMARYGADQAGKDETYIAHPKTWLTQERWLDETKGFGNGHDLSAAFTSPEEMEAQRLAREKAYGIQQSE